MGMAAGCGGAGSPAVDASEGRAVNSEARTAHKAKPGRANTTVRELLIKIKRTFRSIRSQIGRWHWMGLREP